MQEQPQRQRRGVVAFSWRSVSSIWTRGVVQVSFVAGSSSIFFSSRRVDDTIRHGRGPPDFNCGSPDT